jgi:hypothetical protein
MSRDEDRQAESLYWPVELSQALRKAGHCQVAATGRFVAAVGRACRGHDSV